VTNDIKRHFKRHIKSFFPIYNHLIPSENPKNSYYDLFEGSWSYLVAVHLQNLIFVKNSTRKDAIASGEYKILNSRDEAKQFLEDLYLDRLNGELDNRVRKLKEKIVEASSKECIDLIIDVA
jgi:hypothetical protein